MLLCVASFAVVAENMRDALREAVERTIDIVPAAELPLFREVLRFAARQAGCSGSPELRAAARRLFKTITPRLIDLAEDEATSGRCVEHILRAAVDLSREGTRMVSMQAFVDLARVVADAGPIAARTVRTFLTQAARQIPFQQAEALWPLILELRSC